MRWATGKKFGRYLDWYNEKFPDDVGEPEQLLCLAVGLHRMHKDNEAKYALANLMLNNLYIIPLLLGETIQPYDMWHSSNYKRIDYFDCISEDILGLIEKDDLVWIKALYESEQFIHMRKEYIDVYHKLQTVKDAEARGVLLRRARHLLDCLS